MSPHPIRIWTHGACNPHGGHGGWAYVVVQGSTVRGEAGGERGSTPRTMALTAALQALAAIGEGPEAVVLASCDPAIIGGTAPEPDPDAELWNRLAATLAARSVRLTPAPGQAEPRSAAGFVQAWSAFAIDKVKAGGRFRAPIPKSNLSNFPGRGARD